VTGDGEQGVLPLTVIGGYLGAGKTSLVNRVLAGDHGRRVAVVVNDFGDVDLDAVQLRARGAGPADVIELTNGCACCSIADGLVTVFDRLHARRDRFDQVLLEASGVADPARLAAWGTMPGFRVDAVIVLADVERVRSLARDRWVATTIERQLDAADLIVLTHTDLVDARETGAVVEWLGAGWPGIPVVDGATIDSVDLVLDRRSAVAPGDGDRRDAHSAHDDPHRSVTLTFDGPVELDVLQGRLAAASGVGLVRAKGLVRDSATGAIGLVDAVGRRTSWRPLPDGTEAAALDQLVVIGVGGDAPLRALVASLRSAGLGVSVPGWADGGH